MDSSRGTGAHSEVHSQQPDDKERRGREKLLMVSPYSICTVALLSTLGEDMVEVVVYFLPTMFCYLILPLTDLLKPLDSQCHPLFLSPEYSFSCYLALYTHSVVEKMYLIHHLEPTCRWRHVLDSSLKSQFSCQITGTIPRNVGSPEDNNLFFPRLLILKWSPYDLLRSLNGLAPYFPFPDALGFLSHFIKLPFYLSFG